MLLMCLQVNQEYVQVQAIVSQVSSLAKTLEKASNSNTSLNVEKLPWAEKLQVGVWSQKGQAQTVDMHDIPQAKKLHVGVWSLKGQAQTVDMHAYDITQTMTAKKRQTLLIWMKLVLKSYMEFCGSFKILLCFLYRSFHLVLQR